jgi:hypothetical protein
MAIDCPSSTESVAAHPDTDPNPKWICSYGTLTVSRGMSPGQRQQPSARGTTTVSVKVYAGHGVSPPATPPADATAATISGTDWSATLVPVPSAGSSLPGDAQTVVAWQVGSGGVEDRWVTEFYTVDDTVTGATDCCASSGGGARAAVLTADELDVAIPDGANAGAHTAKASGPGAWKMSVGKQQYTLHGGRRLVIRGPSSTAVSKAVEGSPFSATFPGAIFGAKGDVVVTVA